jgi:hypothetical protein
MIAGVCEVAPNRQRK